MRRDQTPDQPRFGPREPGATEPKIFVIGLNKCATRSIHELFQGSGIASAHWQIGERNLAQAMLTNLALARAPFAGFEAIRAFSDITHSSGLQVIEGARFFRDFDTAYPGAYFILNTRPVDAWIASRLNHAKGHFRNASLKASGLDEAELVARWRALWEQHHAEVRSHFAGHPRFTEYDISQDGPDKLAAFLSPDFTLDPALWKVTNRGSHQPRPDPARAQLPLGG